MNYTKIKTFRISKKQHETFLKMKAYNVDVSKFIREAVSEKIKREYNEIIPKTEKKGFSKQTLIILNQLEKTIKL